MRTWRNLLLTYLQISSVSCIPRPRQAWEDLPLVRVDNVPVSPKGIPFVVHTSSPSGENTVIPAPRPPVRPTEIVDPEPSSVKLAPAPSSPLPLVAPIPVQSSETPQLPSPPPEAETPPVEGPPAEPTPKTTVALASTPVVKPPPATLPAKSVTSVPLPEPVSPSTSPAVPAPVPEVSSVAVERSSSILSSSSTPQVNSESQPVPTEASSSTSRASVSTPLVSALSTSTRTSILQSQIPVSEPAPSSSDALESPLPSSTVHSSKTPVRPSLESNEISERRKPTPHALTETTTPVDPEHCTDETLSHAKATSHHSQEQDTTTYVTKTRTMVVTRTRYRSSTQENMSTRTDSQLSTEPRSSPTKKSESSTHHFSLTKHRKSHDKDHKHHETKSTHHHHHHSESHHTSSPGGQRVGLTTTRRTSSTHHTSVSTRRTSSTHHASVSSRQSTSSKTLHLMSTLKTSQKQTLTVSVTVSPHTTGTVLTSLEHTGEPTIQPFNTTVISTPSSSIKPITTGSGVIASSASMVAPSPLSGNIFVPVASGAPPPQIQEWGDHPVPRTGIVNQTVPIETNKFYAGFFLGDRKAGTWTHPYSLAWTSLQGSYGVSVSHIDRSQLVFGPPNTLAPGDPPSYFINPIGLQSVILSAQELGPSTSLTMDTLKAFSANVNLAPNTGVAPILTFPLIQGMGFFTGVYKSATPLLQSSIFFSSLTFRGQVSNGTMGYSTVLMDGNTWLIYITPTAGNTAPTLTLVNNTQIVGNHAFSGSIQVTKNPNNGTSQAIYDASAGVYPVQCSISAAVKNSTGTYSLAWTKAGIVSRKLLMFALPHHVQSFATTMNSQLRTSLQLVTTTKGMATAVAADSWTLVEDDLPTTMDFAPWSPTLGSQKTLATSAVTLMNNVAATELNEDINAQTDLNSMYFAGKGLAKFAFIVYAVNDLGHDSGLASAGLVKLKAAFNRFVNNTQIYPLVYDTSWGGAVSSASYPNVTNNSGIDFGNTYYNDHHFHYGYFVYTAAVIGYLDPSWLEEGTNKAWVNMLVRDYANSVASDGYFPFSRMFDWFHGHSWAHGLFETYDGKDQESSSEDTFSAYALKMWGRTIGDSNMEARGNLMLAIQQRSLNNYYLLQTTNTAEPPNYIANKAAGIIFENKIDHTTYFGTNIEYIEGIHMLPLNPCSTFIRNATFVTQEWDTYFSNGRVDQVAGGWRGILYANLAIIDPTTAYNWFASPDFNNEYLDGGASRTWYLAWAAGLGGA